jgi:hypothetical protein
VPTFVLSSPARFHAPALLATTIRLALLPLPYG